jgi:hypothetical protein
MDLPDVAALGLIAANTRVGQILVIGEAAVLFAEDVIGFAAIERVRFGDQTVFTDLLTSSNDAPTQLGANVSHGHLALPLLHALPSTSLRKSHPVFYLQVMIQLCRLVRGQRLGLLSPNQVSDMRPCLFRWPKINNRLRRTAIRNEIHELVIRNDHQLSPLQVQ